MENLILSELKSCTNASRVISRYRGKIDVKNIITTNTGFLNSQYKNPSISQRLWHIIHDSYEIKKCHVCNEKPTRYHVSRKYGTCSNTCSNSIINDRSKNAIKAKYGVDSVSHMTEFIDKMVKTTRSRNKGLWSNQTENTKNLRKNTYLSKIGVDHNTKTEVYRKWMSDNNPAKTQHSKDLFRQYSISKLMKGTTNVFELLHYDDFLTLLDKRDGMIFKMSKHLFCRRKHRGIEISVIKNPLIKGYSHLELQVYEFIKANYTGDILQNDRTTISPYELDIFLPNENLAIEFNGDYWHANPKFYGAGDIVCMNNKLTTAKSIWDRDTRKQGMCNKLGVKLIVVWENDWLTQKSLVQQELLTIL